MKSKSVQTNILFIHSYWDSALDLKLMLDRSTLNLLYAQTVSDIERGWIITNKDVEEQLAILQSRGAKREVSITLYVFNTNNFSIIH